MKNAIEKTVRRAEVRSTNTRDWTAVLSAIAQKNNCVLIFENHVSNCAHGKIVMEQ